MIYDIAFTIVTMPFNVLLWAILASLPLRLFFRGETLAIASLCASMIVVASIIVFKPNLTFEVRVAGGIAAPFAAMICYSWWLGRQQRKATSGSSQSAPMAG
jgi:hypothetical protein